MKAWIYICGLSLLFLGCYTFKNASVPSDLQYYYVEDFVLTARNAPPTIQTDFQEALKNKIRNESRLVLDQNQAQVLFTGTVSSYNVQALAPEPGATVALNRLNISVQVTYQNFMDTDKDWSQTFSEYAEFSSDVVLSDVEEQLISTIFDQLTENIFNKSFGDW